MCPLLLTQLDATFHTLLYFYWVFYYILPLALECYKKLYLKERGNVTHT